jgi:hypothetical protein
MNNHISYEYNIVLALNTNYNTIIKNELVKLINLIIFMIEVTNKDLNFLCDLFFSETITEYGQIGKQNITTKSQLTDLINTLNIRELFTIINNFRKKIDCFMFELLLTYKKIPESFMQNYQFLDETYIKYIINFIENMLDVDVLDLSLCYNTQFIEIPCEESSKPFYRSLQDDNISYPTWNYSNICSLWLPSTYGNTNQLLMKESKENKLYDVVTKSMKKKIFNKSCTEYIMSLFPFVEPLSPNETRFLELKQSNVNNFLFTICNSEPNDSNFTTQLRKKNNKLIVSYTSGHTVIMLMLCKYFKDINLGLITLGCIIWLVPYNHSITEVFLAAKQVDVFKNYTYKKNTYESINEMLQLLGLSQLNQMVLLSSKNESKLFFNKYIKYKEKYNSLKKKLNPEY